MFKSLLNDNYMTAAIIIGTIAGVAFGFPFSYKRFDQSYVVELSPDNAAVMSSEPTTPDKPATSSTEH